MIAAEGAPLLEFAGADVGYAGVPVVHTASLCVCGGEIVGLIGPNGAGKSTLVRAVTGDAELLGGGLLLGGRDARAMSPAERARSVGVVPQQVLPAFAVPAREFVAMGRHAHLTRFAGLGAHDREVVERAMAATDTLRLAEQHTDELSGGDLQRLAFAQALAQEPRVLLLDEPVSHLDLNHAMQILDLAREIADSGLAVLAIFHDLDLAARYSDRIGVVACGALAEARPPASIITAELLAEVFGVRAVVRTDAITGSVTVTPVLREGAVSAERRGRVLVIGGSGVAAPLVRRLVLGGWEVACGALNLGDADQVIAEALGLEYAEIPPFAPMDEDAERRVAELASAADAIIVTAIPFGHGNLGNLRAAVQAAKGGVRLVLIGDIGGRDYTGGEAEALWAEALRRGARVVPDQEAAERLLAGQ
ncbi:MAG: ABC transporter ATP-binding protein [Coriobacteriia bacterium]